MNPNTPWYMNLVLEWLFFFMHNRDYRRYCWSRRVKREDVRHELECQYPGLAQLYDDWGDIHAVDLFGDTAAQLEWWKPRARLFWDLPHVQWIEDPASYVPRPGHLLLEVPLMDTKAEMMKLFERHLDNIELANKRGIVSTKETYRYVSQPREGSKYHFHPKGWRLSAATKKTLAKAAYVGRLRYRKTPEGKPLSLTDKVLAIKQDPKNPFGWSLTEQDKRDIAKGVYKKGLFGGSEVTLVKRAQKDFDAYVRNTIYGRFPDNS